MFHQINKIVLNKYNNFVCLWAALNLNVCFQAALKLNAQFKLEQTELNPEKHKHQVKFVKL
jgi:hypothetical protein